MEYRNLYTLSFHEKINELKQFGFHLTTRTNAYYYIKLYSIGKFYVEVWASSHMPWEGIERIKILSGTKMLKPYLSEDVFNRVLLG